MNRLTTLKLVLLTAVLGFVSVPVQAAPLQIDFEDLTIISCGLTGGANSTSGGFTFTSTRLFLCGPTANQEFFASNGSNYLGALPDSQTDAEPLAVSMIGGPGVTFDLAGLDVAELRLSLFGGGLLDGPIPITLEGALSGGGTVTAIYTTDGTGDGPNPPGTLTDFEAFGAAASQLTGDPLSSFVGLTSLTFSSTLPFGIDNIFLSDVMSQVAMPVPAPASLLLVGGGLFLLGFSGGRSRKG